MAERNKQLIVQYVLYKLANNQPALIKGIDAIMHDQIVFKYFNRAGLMLFDAKNEQYLKTVEAGLQTVIGEVKRLNANQASYMDNHKTALYLYTLQNLIFNLRTWEFANKRPNNYQPTILQNFDAVKEKGKNLGIDQENVRLACYTSQYRIPNDPTLCNFLFLDEKRIENTSYYLDRYRVTKKTALNINNAQQPLLGDPKLPVLDKVIEILRQKLGHVKLDFAYIVNNLEHFFTMVGETIHNQDRDTIGKVTEAIMHRVLTVEQNIINGIYQFSTATMAILDKVTTAIKKQLGNIALDVHYVMDHIENFFDIVGDTIRKSDKNIIARVAEAVMQRVLTCEKLPPVKKTVRQPVYVAATPERPRL